MIAPGFHENIDAAVYHADALCDVPTLSSSIAKILVRDKPIHAWMKHPRLNPAWEFGDDSKFDLGKVVHELLLGRGEGFVVVDAADWRTKESKTARDAARASGKTPILRHHLGVAETVAIAAIARLVETGVRLDRHSTEAVLLWRDWRDVACRAMLDAVDLENGIVYDVKTTERGLSEDAISRTIDALGYDISAGFYLRGLNALFPHMAGRWVWRWIFLEVDAPHECRVIQATPSTLLTGGKKAAVAIAVWEECLRTNVWPGWPAEIAHGGLNDYAMTRWEAIEQEHPLADIAPFPSRIVPSAPKELLGAC